MHADLRMHLTKGDGQRPDPATAEAARRGDAQYSGHRIAAAQDRGLRLLHLGKDTHAAGVESLALLRQRLPSLRQRLPSRGALDQAHAKAALRRGEALADHGQRQVHLPCRAGQAAGGDDAGEDGQFEQVVDHSSCPGKRPFPPRAFVGARARIIVRPPFPTR